MSKNKILFIIAVLTVILLASSILNEVSSNVNDEPFFNDSERVNVDQTCVSCHEEVVTDFMTSPKNSSFFKPETKNLVERFDSTAFYHRPSKRYYLMSWDGEELLFTRYQIHKGAFVLNRFQVKVDWILGSGRNYRTYLYQTENQELFQLPIAWYTDEEEWNIAPGYNSLVHEGIQKKITKECIFCHTDYPLNFDESNQKNLGFGNHLSQGIGCQRCHGSTEQHVRAALNPQSTNAEVKGSILDLSTFENPQKDDVCNQCHLQPTVAIMGPRKFGRDVFSFEPGQLLTDYMINVDITNPQRNGQRSFELNHSAYQLYQSKCYLKSEGKMSCTTCHDPHKKIPDALKLNHYKEVCMTCHQPHTLNVEQNPKSISLDQCSTCHMPERRTSDVIRVTTTDHLIRVVNQPGVLVEPIEEEKMIIRNVFSYNLPAIDSTSKLYLAVAILKHRNKSHILDYVKNIMKDMRVPSVHPYFYVAEAEIGLNKTEDALKTIEIILNERPEDPLALEWKGLCLIKLDRLAEAGDFLLKAYDMNPERVEVSYNLGLYNYLLKNYDIAIEYFKNSIRLKSNMTISYYYLSLISMDKQDYEDAEDYAKKALDIDPIHTRSYLALKDALMAQGKRDEAIVTLNHAYDIVPNELIIYRELQKL